MELNSNPTPPKWAQKFFRWYCRPDRYEELAGDLDEMYALRAMRGKPWKADLAFLWDVVRCCKAYARRSNYFMETSGALFKSFFKLATRQMLKNKWTIAVNVVGLGFAVSFCMVCYMLYGYNREFDDIYDTENIYRINAFSTTSPSRMEYTPLALEQALENDHSAVEDVVSYLSAGINLKKNKYYFKTQVAFVSSTWLDHFDLPLKYGRRQPLSLQGVYLTEETAIRLFGEANPVGERLSLYYFGRKFPDVEVLGVFKRFPNNTSFHFEAMANVGSIVDFFELDPSSWDTQGFTFGQYVKISPGRVADVAQHLQTYLAPYNEINDTRKYDRLELLPFKHPELADMDLYGYVNVPLATNEFLIFCTMATLILFIACFNLANSNMAMIGSRIKEIGIRKTVGSSTRQIFIQFIFETFIVMTLAFVLALASTNVVSEFILEVYEQPFSLQDLDPSGVAIFAALFLLGVTLLTGLIPALYARRFRPITILNHKVSLKGLGPVHYTLSVFQYTLSIAILLAGLAFMNNGEFMKNRDFGYNPENAMVIRVKDGNEYEKLKSVLQEKPFAKDIFPTYHYLAGYSFKAQIKHHEQEVEINHMQVVDDFLSHMGVRFSSGRDFLTNSTKDIENHVVVNQHFVEQYLTGEALYQQIILNDEEKTIVGVIENYQDGELFLDYRPVPIVYTPGSHEERDFLVLRTNGEPLNEVVQAVESHWASLMDRPMVWHWQHENAYQYSQAASAQVRDIFLALSGVAFLLSFISIAAMATLRVRSSIKQISIRKVLGANTREVLRLINRPFLRILLLSMVLGVTLGYFLSEAIMSSVFLVYASTPIIAGIAIGVGVVIFALIMVTGAAMKPIKANPAHGLRTE